jgi:hypothetical protein
MARRLGFGYNVRQAAWGLIVRRSGTRENGQRAGGVYLLWI